MLGVITSNLLKIGNSWTIVEKYTTTLVDIGTHYFPQFLENSRSHSNAYDALIYSKKHTTIKWERDWWFDDHQNNENCECKVRIVIGA